MEAVPEDEWVHVPDTHEAIITQETFDKVQALLLRDTRTTPNGAEKFDRVKKTFRLTFISATMVMVVAWIVYMAFPLQLIRIFGTESALYEEFAVKCFRIYLLTNFLGGMQLCAGTLFQAIGHPAKATVVSLAKQVIFYIPAMLILAKAFGLVGILWAGPIAEVLAFFLAAVLARKELKGMGNARLEEKA
ncbi:MAG: recombinase family protein [Lachnospiraceae bacterium]